MECVVFDRFLICDEGVVLCVFDDVVLIVFVVCIRVWGCELGFGVIGISDIDFLDVEVGFVVWLEVGYYGEMDYMVKYGMKCVWLVEFVVGM